MQHNFKELKAWQMGIDVAEMVYKTTAEFPSEEKFGLISQMRRSAVSVPSNIAEGCGRGTDAQLAHFLDVALGSSFELETQLIISKRVNLIDDEGAQALEEKINHNQRLIFNFKKSLSKNS